MLSFSSTNTSKFSSGLLLIHSLVLGIALTQGQDLALGLALCEVLVVLLGTMRNPQVIQKLLNQTSDLQSHKRQWLPLSCDEGEPLLAIQDLRHVAVDFRFSSRDSSYHLFLILQMDQGKYHFKFMAFPGHLHFLCEGI